MYFFEPDRGYLNKPKEIRTYWLGGNLAAYAEYTYVFNVEDPHQEGFWYYQIFWGNSKLDHDERFRYYQMLDDLKDEIRYREGNYKVVFNISRSDYDLATSDIGMDVLKLSKDKYDSRYYFDVDGNVCRVHDTWENAYIIYHLETDDYKTSGDVNEEEEKKLVRLAKEYIDYCKENDIR